MAGQKLVRSANDPTETSLKRRQAACQRRSVHDLLLNERAATMTPLPTEPSRQPTSAGTPSSTILKFSKKRLAAAFVVAGISDAIGAFTTPLPPIGWVVDLATALLLFILLGRQWLLLPGLVLEAIPGVGILPFWLLVVGAIAVLGTPRPMFERH